MSSAPAPRLGDFPTVAFRRVGHAVIDRIADFLGSLEDRPVMPDVRPGDLRARLPTAPPEEPEPLSDILSDLETRVLPAATIWNHPRFHAWFCSSASTPAMVAEMWTTAINANTMTWRSCPAGTELEEIVLAWLRSMLGLPDGWTGVIFEGGSTSTLHALAAAREAMGDVRRRGLTARDDLDSPVVYVSEQAHSSVDKALVMLGLGLDSIRRVPVDGRFAMKPGALRAAIAEDRAAGLRPLAAVATVGTTSVGAVDPVAPLAAICRADGVWLHVDAAWGGAAALARPELLHGCALADSLVVNPHKGLFVPLDLSVLFVRRERDLSRVFSFSPPYLEDDDSRGARNYMDLGVPLGRRFRALKLWFTIRAFGVEGLRRRVEEQLRLAKAFARRVDACEVLERMAPVRLPLVVFRLADPARSPEDLDRSTRALLDRVNATGEMLVTGTRVDGREAVRFVVGSLHTRETHVLRAWRSIESSARSVLRGAVAR